MWPNNDNQTIQSAYKNFDARLKLIETYVSTRIKFPLQSVNSKDARSSMNQTMDSIVFDSKFFQHVLSALNIWRCVLSFGRCYCRNGWMSSLFGFLCDMFQSVATDWRLPWILRVYIMAHTGIWCPPKYWWSRSCKGHLLEIISSKVRRASYRVRDENSK